jgi:hypothetical protein
MRLPPLLLSLACACLLLTGCTGGGSTLSTDPGAGRTAPSAKAQSLEVAIGMSAAQVGQLLGNASSTGVDSQGRETWTYDRNRANYVYSANRNSRRVMIVDGYGSGNGLSTYIVITFDQAKRVADFSYQQMSF